MATPLAATPLEYPKKAHKSAHVGFADDVEREVPVTHADAPQTPRSPISIHSTPPGSPRHDYFAHMPESTISDPEKQDQTSASRSLSSAEPGRTLDADQVSEQVSIHYTDYYRTAPSKTYRQSLKPWNGRLAKDKWLKVMVRPFILFAYPAVLWSSMAYALAVGWLIVLSESIAHIYQNRESYNFTALQVGLVYISPFIGGVLGTAVAGKVSDLIVRFMARRNDGVYEPEFRLVMAIPITISTVIGLMGFGWSAEEKDNFMVPTFFFGLISFGCCLASTTAITFVVDSYRVYAGEALVTLNFSKSKLPCSVPDIFVILIRLDVLHGFIFSLFFPHWLEAKGPKSTFLAIGRLGHYWTCFAWLIIT